MIKPEDVPLGVRRGFCRHYRKTFGEPGTCAVGLDPHALKNDEQFLPIRYMPCIPEKPVWCSKREETANERSNIGQR